MCGSSSILVTSVVKEAYLNSNSCWFDFHIPNGTFVLNKLWFTFLCSNTRTFVWSAFYLKQLWVCKSLLGQLQYSTSGMRIPVIINFVFSWNFCNDLCNNAELWKLEWKREREKEREKRELSNHMNLWERESVRDCQIILNNQTRDGERDNKVMISHQRSKGRLLEVVQNQSLSPGVL